MAHVLQHLAKQIAQIFKHRFGSRRIRAHQRNGAVERVEQKMGANTRLQFGQLRLHIAWRLQLPAQHQQRYQHRSQQAACDFLETVSAATLDWPEAAEVLIFPPVPAPIQRVADVERAQMLLEASSRQALHRLLARWQPVLQQAAARTGEARVLRWALDVDPLAI